MGRKPVIGISCSFDYDKNFSFLKAGYYKAIIQAGGLPVVIPAMEQLEVVDELLPRFDGILLPGGPDLDARLYGETNLAFNGDISPVRDAMEMHLARKAAELGKPILGICRGAQLINVAFGGTLYQDISSQCKGEPIEKHSQDAPSWYPIHNIYLEEGSGCRSWFSANPARVNSFHHQAVKVVAPGFRIAAKTADGIVEAIESSDDRYIVGVQWHPETMWEQNPELLAMFVDFVAHCRQGE